MHGLPAVRHLILVFTLAICSNRASANSGLDGDIRVVVETHGDLVIVDAGLTLPVSPEEAWRVLTDFDHMTSFISNLQYSKIISASDGTVLVAQKGKSSHGLFSFSFESTKEYTLMPFEKIRTRLVAGTFKKFEGLMELTADGAATRLAYHGESIPEVWMPPIVGPALVRAEIREQFGELRAEILRRKHLAEQ